MSEERVKRSREDVMAYLAPFGLPDAALDSLRGSFDLWHEKRVAVEEERDSLIEAIKDYVDKGTSQKWHDEEFEAAWNVLKGIANG